MAKIDGPSADRPGQPETKPRRAGPEAVDPDATHRFSDLMSRQGREHGHESDADGNEPGPQGKAGAAPGGKPATQNSAPRQAASGRAGVPSSAPQPSPSPAARLPGPATEPLHGTSVGQAEVSHGGARSRTGENAGDDAARIAAEGGFAGPGMTALAEPLQPLGPVASPAAPQAADTDLLTELADRILVAEPETGRDEVRIRLNLDTLQGAEIAIRRDAHGLQVTFETPSPEIAERLSEARDDLAERLAEKTGQAVMIEISSPRHDASGDTGDGRSRNRFDYSPEPGDDA